MSERRQLSFGERFTIALFVLLMAFSDGCTVWVLATAKEDQGLLTADAMFYGVGFFLICLFALLLVLFNIWRARARSSRF